MFDTETTGLLLPSPTPLKEQPHIIELALVEISQTHHDKWEKTGEHTWLINPEVEITDEITKITGLTTDDVKIERTFPLVLPEIEDVVIGAAGLIAHNLAFDRGMLVNELRRVNREFSFPYPPRQICTVEAFKHLKGRRLKQTELYEIVMEKPLAQTHRALDDARALAEVVLKSGLLED